MKLNTYLNENNLSQAAFAAMIGVSQAAVERYSNGKRIPEPPVMREIARVTDGMVTANDFYLINGKQAS